MKEIGSEPERGLGTKSLLRVSSSELTIKKERSAWGTGLRTGTGDRYIWGVISFILVTS